jgi:hypothetical protein
VKNNVQGGVVITDAQSHCDAIILSALDDPHSRERWRDRLYKKLSHQGEVRLTNLERMVLLELLTQKKRVRGRPIDKGKGFRDFAIDVYMASLEDGGQPTEAAVAAAEKEFGIKRSTVFAAKTRRRRPESK